MDSWRATAPLLFQSMRAAPDISFDKNRNPGSAPRYQAYIKIQVACPNARSRLIEWRSCDEELDGEFRDKREEENLPNKIGSLNRMHRELCGIADLIHAADRVEVLSQYQCFWTVRTGDPSSRTRLMCSFDGIDFKAFKVPFDSERKGTNVPRCKPKTSLSSCKNIIHWHSHTPTMWSAWGAN